MITIKTQIYDDFHCIADQCPMTCCQGWSIKVDRKTSEKWQSHGDTAYLMEYTIPRDEEEAPREMATDDAGTCLLLDSQGLCKLVIKHGDGYLCDTCAHFPRKRNEITELDEQDKEQNKEQVLIAEYSLSGACPVVMDMLAGLKGGLGLQVTGDCEQGIQFPMEYRVRNQLIAMIQGESIYQKFMFVERIMLGFSLLHECLDCDTEENVDDCLEVYGDPENLREKALFWGKMQTPIEDVMEELCQTFWNVTEYYKELPMYRDYVYELADTVDRWYPETDTKTAAKLRMQACDTWEEHKQRFACFDGLAQRVMAAEIFSDCVSDDLGELTENFQAIILEYVMTRMSVFLLGEYDEKTVETFYSLYIRIIGHNAEGMAEYWKENFDDSILEQEYLYLLLS